MAFTRILRRLHQYVSLIFTQRRLTTDIVRLVLVLDWPTVRRGTPRRRIYLALDHFVCLCDNERIALFLDQGPLVSRPSENSFVSRSHSIANATHKFPSYPIAYAIIVLPVSIARWSSFKNQNVPSAATFFSVVVFNLSGAINVLLLLVRPELLLFSPPPKASSESEGAEFGHPTTGSAIVTDTAIYDQSPQPTGVALVEDEEWDPPVDGNNMALAPIESRTDII